MGCDIHLLPEVKKDWGWQFVWRFQEDDFWKDRFPRPDRQNYFGWEDRNYAVFCKLAGVRADHAIKPIAEPRGTPKDVDTDTKEEMECEDYHSHSWLTLKELQDANWSIPKEYKWDPFKEFKETTIARLKKLDPNPENVRIVFAFDN